MIDDRIQTSEDLGYELITILKENVFWDKTYFW